MQLLQFNLSKNLPLDIVNLNKDINQLINVNNCILNWAWKWTMNPWKWYNMIITLIYLPYFILAEVSGSWLALKLSFYFDCSTSIKPQFKMLNIIFVKIQSSQGRSLFKLLKPYLSPIILVSFTLQLSCEIAQFNFFFE